MITQYEKALDLIDCLNDKIEQMQLLVVHVQRLIVESDFAESQEPRDNMIDAIPKLQARIAKLEDRRSYVQKHWH